MKNRIIPIIVVLFISNTFFISCKDDEKEGPHKEVNEWISSIMHDAYLWTNTVTNNKWSPSSHDDPIDYFSSLLYASEDHWSYITDDYDALYADLTGTPESMGFSPIFAKSTGSNNVFFFVAYVYDDSPADRAGLKRGDFVTKINGITLNTSNYVNLTYGSSITATLAVVNDGTITETGETVTMTAEVLNVDPVLHEEVFTYDSKIIGYVAISEFIDSLPFVQSLSNTFDNLKSEGINELIVDLRYNRGGSLSSAIWLASAIGPSSIFENGAVLTELEFNSYLQSIYSQDGQNYYRFAPTTPNLNLNKVYFLTTSNSASASELVISGLEPYIEIVTVGETSHGKWVGSSLFPHPDENRSHNYGILPIMFKYKNAAGQTVKGGIAPTVEVIDSWANAVPFGDVTDPVLAEAIELITGIAKAPAVKSSDLQLPKENLFSPKQLRKMNLILD